MQSAVLSCADESVIQRCVAGDGGAWRDLHRALYPTAVAFLRKMGVRSAELDDVCQEVFVQVFRYLGRFQGRSDLSTWLYRICISQVGRLHRREKVSRLLGTLFGPREAATTQASIELPESEVSRRVRAAIARLSPRHRDAFVLYELEGLPGDEIARVLDCPIATVWTRLHYARAEFQRAISDDEPIASRTPAERAGTRALPGGQGSSGSHGRRARASG